MLFSATTLLALAMATPSLAAPATTAPAIPAALAKRDICSNYQFMVRSVCVSTF